MTILQNNVKVQSKSTYFILIDCFDFDRVSVKLECN